MIGLVGCAATKLRAIVPAHVMYCSHLFRMASAYCESQCDQWFILSAQHGLLAPDDVIEYYDLDIRKMCPFSRRWWAQGVSVKLARLGLLREAIEIHAGIYYSQPLLEWIEHATTPLHGLGIGARLAWYKERRDAVSQRQ